MIERFRQWFARQREARRVAALAERAVVVTTNDAGISATYPSGEVSSIDWSAIRLIAVETNDSGPWGYDVWWVLEGEPGRCVYPSGATGDIEALKVMEARFQGFDDGAVIKAMGCTSNHRFVCWEAHAP
jgi:hypothetical protein